MNARQLIMYAADVGYPPGCPGRASDRTGAPGGVAGAALGIEVRGGGTEGGGIADIETQVSQSRAQSQRSPWAADNSIEVPLTSTGSP
jgi:hypothetical protein